MSSPNGQLSESTKISKTKQPPCGRRPGSLPSCVPGDVCIPDSLPGGGCSLRWLPLQLKLESGTCITKRKANSQDLNCNYSHVFVVMLV